MSILRKTPYIEAKVALLSDAEKSALVSALNNSSGNIPQAKINSLPNGVVAGAVEYTFLDGSIKTAILVNATSVKMLICYHRYQDLQMWELDTTNYKETKINEYLDINELRRVLRDATDSQESAWEQALKTHLYYDAEEETIVGDDATIDNVFANEEIEFADETGDFGTNAKAKIQAKVEESVPNASGHVGKFLQHITTGNSWEPIQANDIATMTSDNGKVLMANGSGGASFENLPIVDNVTSTSATSALSANQGKVLNDRINNVESRGRFLSIWNATSGQPNDLPSDIATNAYTYRTGDYFIVGTGGDKVPSGTSIPAGTTIPTFPSTTGSTSVANDTIIYNGSTWAIYHTPTPTVDQTYNASSTNAQSGTAVAQAVSGKQDALTEGVGIDITSNVIKCEGVEYKNNTTIQTNPLKFIRMTQAQYNAITPDANTFYIIVG